MEDLLSLIEITKSKRSLLSSMMQLEINNQIDTKEYVEILNNYKLTCFVYNKKLRSLSNQDRENLISKMELLNPKLFKVVMLQQLLNSSDNLIILNKIIHDLNNTSLMSFYTNNNSNNDIKNVLCSLFGFNLNNNDGVINSEMVNEYMCQDFINSLFLTIDSNIKKEDNLENKEMLLYWKYQLVLLFPFLEQENIITNFSVSESNKLTDVISIETTGINIGEYTEKFDSAIINVIMTMINQDLSLSMKDNDFKLDLIILETFIELLSNNEYAEIIGNEIECYIDDLSPKNKEKAHKILNILENKKDVNYKLGRQYIRI